MKTLTIVICAITAFGLPACIAQAQDAGDGSKTIVLTDPDHPLNGTWQYANAAGAVVCPTMTVPLPAEAPVPVTIVVSDGGARIRMHAPAGNIDFQRVEVAQWSSETNGERQVLRRTVRSDNAALMARAMAGDATLFEGTLVPTAGMTVRYILGWLHGDPDVLRGHYVATFQPDCIVKRAFQATRGD